MVGSVNKTILLGNLGRDPEIRSMQSGAKMASFSIATSKRWKDRNTQEQKEKYIKPTMLEIFYKRDPH